MKSKLNSSLREALITLFKNEVKISQHGKENIFKWTAVVDNSSIFPIQYSMELARAIINSVTQKQPLVFHMIICPAYLNQKNKSFIKKPRRLVPLSTSNPRLLNFVREVLALSIGTKPLLGLYPEFVFLINDIFQDNTEQMVEDIDKAAEILRQTRKAIIEAFALIERTNSSNSQPFFKKIGFKTPKIYMQSDFISQLGNINLPSYPELLNKVRFLTYDPTSYAFRLFLENLSRVRRDYSYSPNSWLSERGRAIMWDRVRFLVSQYWIDGRINPILIKKILRKATNETIFICGVDRQLAAEFEMDGFNFGAVSTDKLSGISLPRGLNPVCAIFKNVANWLDPPKPPFNFGGMVTLR